MKLSGLQSEIIFPRHETASLSPSANDPSRSNLTISSFITANEGAFVAMDGTLTTLKRKSLIVS